MREWEDGEYRLSRGYCKVLVESLEFIRSSGGFIIYGQSYRLDNEVLTLQTGRNYVQGMYLE